MNDTDLRQAVTDALEFEPIHRVLFGVHGDFMSALREKFGENLAYTPAATPETMLASIHAASKDGAPHPFGIVAAGACGSAQILNSKSSSPVGAMQTFLDSYLKQGGAERIDYVHGEDIVIRLGRQPGNVGICLPVLNKSDLFKTVILEGALPRKSFSMGEAREKRFYLEARKLS